jgi:hypothetical protein
MDHLRAFGGGALKLVNNSQGGAYGNLVVSDLYGNLVAGGAAHGFDAVSTLGNLNLVEFNRIQINVEPGGAVLGGTDATSAQKAFKGAQLDRYSIVAPDFETTVGSTCDFGTTNYKTIDPTGIFCGVALSTTGGHLRSPAPTIAAGPGAGTAPAASACTGDDYAGTINLAIGTAPPAAGQRIARVTWSRQGTRNCVQVGPKEGFSGPLGFYATAITPNGFDIFANGVPTASGAYTLTYDAPS